MLKHLFLLFVVESFSGETETMIKAVFLDYSGTAVSIEGKDMNEMIRIIVKAAKGQADPKELVKYWFERLDEKEKTCILDAYQDEDALVYEVLKEVEQKYGFETDRDRLHDLNQHIWRTADLFADTESFFARTSVPIYVLTNNTASYVMNNLLQKGAAPAGVISADDVRAFKPHHLIFEKALQTAGCQPSEALHIGDSLTSDVLGALKCGIQAVLLDRKNRMEAGTHAIQDEKGREYTYTCVHSLDDVNI
jgi:HAD superfamily hydrolase (TIGR01549 family)